MTFRTDLRVGRHGERIVRQALERAGVVCLSWRGTGGADLYCSLCGVPFAVEVKWDRMASQTGNLAIEVSNPQKGQASGLFATEAQLWAQVIGETVWMASVRELIALVEMRSGQMVCAVGDGNADICLYPLPEVCGSVFHRVSKQEILRKVSL